MKLSEAKKNQWYRLTQLPNLPMLSGIGFISGEKIFLRFRQPLSGPIILRLHHRYFAIGFSLAEKILVEPLLEK